MKFCELFFAGPTCKCSVTAFRFNSQAALKCTQTGSSQVQNQFLCIYMRRVKALASESLASPDDAQAAQPDSPESKILAAFVTLAKKTETAENHDIERTLFDALDHERRAKIAFSGCAPIIPD